MASDVEVTQADRDAADEYYPPHLWRKEARDDLAKAFARHRLSTLPERDALPAKLQEAWEGIDHFSDAVAYRDDPLAVGLRQWINEFRALLSQEGGEG